jgi:hypothetical protein
MDIHPGCPTKYQYSTNNKMTHTLTPRVRHPSVLIRVSSSQVEARHLAECRFRILMFLTRSRMNHLRLTHLWLISLPRRINPTLTTELKDLCLSWRWTASAARTPVIHHISPHKHSFVSSRITYNLISLHNFSSVSSLCCHSHRLSHRQHSLCIQFALTWDISEFIPLTEFEYCLET